MSLFVNFYSFSLFSSYKILLFPRVCLTLRSKKKFDLQPHLSPSGLVPYRIHPSTQLVEILVSRLLEARSAQRQQDRSLRGHAMPQLSDIEECSPSGSTVEANDEHHQSKTKTTNDDQRDASAGLPHPSSGNNNISHHSMGRAQGLKLRPASSSSAHGQHQSAPTSMTVFSPALLPPHSSTSSCSSSSSSSERTITPPHSSHRVSSSGTVQIVSPGATSSGMAALFPGVWPSSPLGRVGEEGVVGSEASSTATVPAYDYQSQDRRRRYHPLAGDGSGSGGRRMTPFWWTEDGSAAGDVPPQRGDDDGERVRLLGGRGATGEVRGLVNVVVHGVVLAMQSGVAVGVLTVFVWVGVWMDDDGGLSGVSGEM